jgi:O-antigen ligase/tetratricopeptide (TPR) repeat protein
MELVLLVLVCLSPWALGAAEPGFEAILYAGVAVLLLLWAARVLVAGEFTWTHCPVALCLAGLFLLGFAQLMPLPRPALAWLSPATCHLHDELLPAEPEALPAEAIEVTLPARSRLSLNPGATRTELVRLLAVFLVFAIVRANLTSVEALRRLAVAALVNGALLALFGIAQSIGAPPHTLYWTLPVPNQPFGPFICRNHFPFYLNLCVGLGLGLLLSRTDTRGKHSLDPAGLLQDSSALWIVASLALMIASIFLSLSRGGILALCGAGFVSLLFWGGRGARRSWLQTVLLVGVLSLGIAAWLGLDPVAKRLGTLWTGAAWQDDRLPVWSDMLPSARSFPLWGTGYGTFEQVELVYRTTPGSANVVYEHAHNDYLEALVEGGVARLLLSVTAIFLVIRFGGRALRRHTGRPAGLALGCLFAFTTLLLHSFVDFGLHLPAIALLATVLCAHLCALGDEPARRVTCLRLGRLAPLAAAVLAVLLGGLLCVEGWRWTVAQNYRLAAARLYERPDAEGQERRLVLLEAALRTLPERANLHLEVGRARWLWYQAQRDRADASEEELDRKYLLPALRAYLEARDLCPLMAEPNMRLAAYAGKLDRADTPETYLNRAKRLLPSDPQVWYLAGLQEAEAGRLDEASRSWRRSLTMSNRFLAPILDRAAKKLAPQELLDNLLPDEPELLCAAASHLYPAGQGIEERHQLYQKALQLLEARPAPNPRDLHLQAELHSALGQRESAVKAFRAALEGAPLEVGWRLECGRLLYEMGQRAEARRELLTVLGQEPEHEEARQLLMQLERETAEGK